VSAEDDKSASPAAEAKPAEKPKPGGRIEDLPKPAEKPKRTPQDLGYPGDPPSWWKTLRADPPLYIRIALGAAFIAILVFVWWFVTRGDYRTAIIKPTMVPSPGRTLHDAPGLLDRHLDDHLFASLRRVFIGISLAAVFGVGFGILAGALRGVAAALNPLILFLRSIPMGALGPLMLAIFSTGEKQKWMFILIAVVPFVFGDTVKAMSTVPERYVETAQTLGATRWQIVRKVLVPLALPDIITSLRFQFGLALGYIVLVETTGIIGEGLGGMFNISAQKGEIGHIWALLFVVAAVAFTIDFLLRFLQRGFFPYRKDL